MSYGNAEKRTVKTVTVREKKYFLILVKVMYLNLKKIGKVKLDMHT